METRTKNNNQQRRERRGHSGPIGRASIIIKLITGTGGVIAVIPANRPIPSFSRKIMCFLDLAAPVFCKISIKITVSCLTELSVFDTKTLPMRLLVAYVAQ